MKINVIYIAVGSPFGSDKSLKCFLESVDSQKNINPLIVVPNSYNKKNNNVNHAKYLKLPIEFEVYSKNSFSTFKSLFHNIVKKPIKRIVSYVLLQRVINSFKPDIIHTNVGVYSIGYRLARLNKIPHIWHIREFQTLDMNVKIIGGLNRRKKLFNNNFNIPIAITKSIYDYFELQRNQRSLVVYNGIKSRDEIVFNPEKERYLLYVGQIVGFKGVEDIVDAFCLYNKNKKSDLNLILVGDEMQNVSFTQKLKSKIKSNKLEDKVIFKGLQKQKEVDLYMQKALATIVASYNEALGRVTIEAMFNGSLVIGRDTAGTKEQFDIGKDKIGSEIALRYSTIEELVNKIESVDNNIESYFDMIEDSQKVVSSIYSIEEYSKKILNLYHKLLKNDINSLNII